MKILEVKILSASKENDYYNVSYLVEVKDGILRRSRAVFYNGVLSREKKNKKLVNRIKEVVAEYADQ
jgi:hypothetical protein